MEKAINEYAAEDVGSPKYFKLIIAILDLFNRQQAEIERLQTENRILSQKRVNLFERLEIIEKTKVKAIKEYKNKVKSNLQHIPQHHFTLLAVEECLDEVDKEMVGDAE